MESFVRQLDGVAAVMAEPRQILVEYRKDITKYDEQNSLRIREVCDRLAPELNKKNKRFYVNSIKEGERAERLEDEFVWLKEAGVALPTYVADEPMVPLMLSQRQVYRIPLLKTVGGFCLNVMIWRDKIKSKT